MREADHMSEDDLEGLFESPRRAKRGEQREGKEEGAIEASLGDSGRGPFLTDSLRSMFPRDLPHDVYDEIRALSTKPIDYETIRDTFTVAKMVQAEGLQQIVKVAEDKFLMWLRKRGEGLPKPSQDKMRGELITREFINVALRHVNWAFGYSGTEALKAFQFGLNLYKKVKERPVLEWPKVAEEMIGLWKFKPGFKEDYLRACAHMLLKMLYYLAELSKKL
jgi:hypothetical protein